MAVPDFILDSDAAPVFIQGLCQLCGAHFLQTERPKTCPICEDVRGLGFTPRGGARITTLEEMQSAFTLEFRDEEPYLVGMGMKPDFSAGHIVRSRALLALDRADEAVRAMEQAGWNPGLLGWVYGHVGRESDARRVLAELVAASSQRYVSPMEFARVHLGLGEFDEALDWLERAESERSAVLTSIGVEPRYDPLREHPRFESLIRRLALPGLARPGTGEG